jgi:hypothetical protein
MKSRPSSRPCPQDAARAKSPSWLVSRVTGASRGINTEAAQHHHFSTDLMDEIVTVLVAGRFVRLRAMIATHIKRNSYLPNITYQTELKA